MTTNFSRGISTLRFLRLCWRAPLILITCAAILTRNVEPISQARPLLFSSEIGGSEDETSPLIDKGCLLRHTTGPQEQFEEIRGLVITSDAKPKPQCATCQTASQSLEIAFFALLASYQIALPRQVIREKRN